MSIPRLRDQYQVELTRALVGYGESMLDVGCGANSPMRVCADAIPRRVGVDSYAPSIARSRVAIFTTMGFVPQDEVEGNPNQRHLSGWKEACR